MGRQKAKEPMKMRAFMMTDFEYERFKRNIDWVSYQEGEKLDMAKIVRKLIEDFNKGIELKRAFKNAGFTE